METGGKGLHPRVAGDSWARKKNSEYGEKMYMIVFSKCLHVCVGVDNNCVYAPAQKPI